MGMNTKSILTISCVSTNDLSSYQYYGVKLSADETIILPTADTDVCIGILQNKPEAGEVAEIMVIGVTPVVTGEGVTYGNEIRIASGGKAMVFAPDTDTTAYGCGQALTTSTADGEYAKAVVNFAVQDRGEE